MLLMVTATVAHNGHNDCNDHDDEDKTTHRTTNDCTKIFWVVYSSGAHNEDFKLTHHRQVALKAHTNL